MKNHPSDSLKSSALRLLATREHSREELRRKLATKASETDELEAVLDRMVETGLQSDERFAESYVRAKADRLGMARIRRELIERGIGADVVAAALEGTLENDELTRAKGVWARKFGEPPRDRTEWAKQARFMQSRGFAVEVIRKLLKEPFDESAQG